MQETTDSGEELPDDGDIVTLTPGIDAEGMRLDRWLADSLSDISRSRIKSLILQGMVSSGGAKISEPKTPVKPGVEVEVRLPPPEPAIPEPQDIPLDVVYEDAALIVVNKPAGMAVHPAPGTHDGTLVNALLFRCRGELSGIGGVARPGIVHRLDKDTSGLIVVAKNDRAHNALAAQFADHSAGRTYEAVVWGCPAPGEGTVDAPIGRDSKARKRMAVVRNGHGKEAVTHYRVEKRLGLGASLVSCRLETGRTHQIRVHLTHIGHPLIGDSVYGRVTSARRSRLPDAAREAATSFPRQALHAAELKFAHPVSGEEMRFEAPTPADMVELMAVLAG